MHKHGCPTCAFASNTVIVVLGFMVSVLMVVLVLICDWFVFLPQMNLSSTW